VSDPRPTNPFSTSPAVPAWQAEEPATPVRVDAKTQQAFLTQAFVWMFAGLALTAGVSFVVQGNERLLRFAYDNVLLLFIGQFVLVLAIQFMIRRINATVALGAFFVYAASLGLTIGLIVAAYTQASVVSAFLSASAMFGGAAIYGAVTKRSLASIGGYLTMGLIGLIVAMIVNAFIGSGPLSYAISIVGVVIFTALTAYDVQRINNGDLRWIKTRDAASVVGALFLYIDFINLFISMLRIFGSRR
jgi:FtsH-binding integral membrane protein